MKRCIICDTIKVKDGSPMYDLDRCDKCLVKMILEDNDVLDLLQEAANI